MSPAQAMDGPGNQLFPGAGFCPRINTVASVGATISTSALTPVSNAPAIADDIVETMFEANLLFEIVLLLGQPVFEFGDLLIGQGIVHRERNLSGHLTEKLTSCSTNACSRRLARLRQPITRSRGQQRQ